jgi:hypothetical protein
MTPLECERIFERIEEYKRSIEKYIQDVASLVEKVANVVEVDEGVDMDEGVDEVMNNEDLVDFLIETFDLNFFKK